ncbi:MAG TPA: glycogen-binding domain-containing protein [Candidatus Acidoferrum sp.]|nr:glycogen-binding domain-containing protein [Candidatus Acidoferrum sp.]
MAQEFGNAFLKKPASAGGLVIPPVKSALHPAVRKPATPPRPQTYSKVFRWRLPDGQTQAPATVEIVGGFTHWQKVPLHRDGALDAWHVTLHNLHCGRMYHYMLLVDGQPVRDKHCDGLAVPHGPQEEQYQLMTDRGPRVLMLFAQTK